MDQNEPLRLLRQGKPCSFKKKVASVCWLDEVNRETSVILHARKDGDDNEETGKGGKSWKHFDSKNHQTQMTNWMKTMELWASPELRCQ